MIEEPRVEPVTGTLEDAFKELYKHRSWSLERISPTTYWKDLKDGGKLPHQELSRMIRRGQCFRCRIRRGHYEYGSTALEAITAALKGADNAG